MYMYTENNAQLQQSCHFLHKRVICIVLRLHLYIWLDLRLWTVFSFTWTVVTTICMQFIIMHIQLLKVIIICKPCIPLILSGDKYFIICDFSIINCQSIFVFIRFQQAKSVLLTITTTMHVTLQEYLQTTVRTLPLRQLWAQKNRYGYTTASPDEYNWTIHAQWQCRLISN